MSADDPAKFQRVMARSFEQGEVHYLRARQKCGSDLGVLVATSDDQRSPEALEEFDEDNTYRVFLEQAVIRRRIANESVSAISVMVYPRESLAFAFEQNGHDDMVRAIDLNATSGKMTILLKNNNI